ncbi:helix-turn-helix domain-containing protein [Gottfriedia acidiceleris]|uniref:helix-turn-helix domain-containing protein n=1 Tax=Gottfriedia acidiceleris TaxID=371036 RepID=UPI002FFE6B18
MTLQIGKKIRYIRANLGISLNSFAKEIGVSPAYLSNLENEKTDTIAIPVLEMLQKKYNLISNEQEDITPFHIDAQITFLNLLSLNMTNPRASSFILENLKNTLQYFKNDSPTDNE